MIALMFGILKPSPFSGGRVILIEPFNIAADMAVYDADGFSELAEVARTAAEA